MTTLIVLAVIAFFVLRSVWGKLSDEQKHPFRKTLDDVRGQLNQHVGSAPPPLPRRSTANIRPIPEPQGQPLAHPEAWYTPPGDQVAPPQPPAFPVGQPAYGPEPQPAWPAQPWEQAAPAAAPAAPAAAHPELEVAPARQAPAQVEEPSTTRPHRDGVGSAALESTLDSVIESSLLGMPPGESTFDTIPGPEPAQLTTEMEARVRDTLANAGQVAAVRLLADELDLNLLVAMETIRLIERTATE